MATLCNVIPLVLVLVYATAETTQKVPNRCPTYSPTSTVIFYEHPEKCSSYFRCDHGVEREENCAPGTVWSQQYQTCVGFNSHFDTCTPKTTQKVPNRCPTNSATSTGIFYEHPEKCSSYFRCDHGVEREENCAPGTVWSQQYQTCVGFNSHFDTCTPKTTQKVSNRCPRNSATSTVIFYEHPEKCSSYFRCDHGVEREEKCAPGTVWSQNYQTCVGFNSHFDTCTRENAQRECSGANGVQILIPHPTKCQRYYNCSATGPLPWRSYLGQYEKECTYPDVFDVVEKKCVSYKVGYCGPNRVADKDPCDYVLNRCRGSHCQPCSSRMPSCVGLSDGVHEHPLRLWTPYYIVCESERLVGVKTCEGHAQTLTTALYSPEKQACVSVWEVPRRYGGSQPSCALRRPGKYQTVERQDVYYTCPGATVFYCGLGARFNAARGQWKQTENKFDWSTNGGNKWSQSIRLKYKLGLS